MRALELTRIRRDAVRRPTVHLPGESRRMADRRLSFGVGHQRVGHLRSRNRDDELGSVLEHDLPVAAFIGTRERPAFAAPVKVGELVVPPFGVDPYCLLIHVSRPFTPCLS